MTTITYWTQNDFIYSYSGIIFTVCVLTWLYMYKEGTNSKITGGKVHELAASSLLSRAGRRCANR